MLMVSHPSRKWSDREPPGVEMVSHLGVDLAPFEVDPKPPACGNSATQFDV